MFGRRFPETYSGQFTREIRQKLLMPCADLVEQFRRRIVPGERSPAAKFNLLIRKVGVCEWFPGEETVRGILLSPFERCPLFLSAIGLALMLVACKDGQTPPMPDFTPIGDGLKTLGYAIVGGAVVLTLGRLLR